jgi:hypothetical protein
VKRRVSYEPLELGLPGVEKCPNAYEPDSTLECRGAKKLILQVGVNAIKLRTGIYQQGATSGLGNITWQPHETFLPCFAALERDFDAVQVHNRFAGEEAQVVISVET